MDNLTSYAFLAPWLLGFFILTLYPMVYSLFLSFTEFNLIQPPEWVGFRNYIVMFGGNDSYSADPRFLNSLFVTFRFVFISVPVKLVFALGVAMLMNQKLRLIPFYRTLYYIPTLLGGSVAIAVLWRRLFAADGVVNVILSAVFNVADAPAWISDPRYALYTLIILAVWQFGSSMLIFLAGLKQIPESYYDAASIDGAGPFTQFFKITIPFMTPIIFFNLVMQMVHGFTVFTQAFVVSGGTGDPLNSTLVYALYLYQRAFRYSEMGYSSALAWVLVVIIGIFTALIFRSSRFWVYYETKEGK